MTTDEITSTQPDEEIEGFASDQSLDIIEDTLNTFLGAASVDAVYSKPVRDNGNLLIQSAEVLAVMGFGVGSGYGPGSGDEGEKDGSSAGGGSGGGGGGRVLARPVAVIISSQEGVRVEPVIDITKIALAALTAAGFMVGMIARMLRSPDIDRD